MVGGGRQAPAHQRHSLGQGQCRTIVVDERKAQRAQAVPDAHAQQQVCPRWGCFPFVPQSSLILICFLQDKS